MKPLFIIPARGGSKGIPRKNIRPLNGKPLIAYTIEEAFKAREILGGHIMLSTDDEEIAETAACYGLESRYRRPAELATDNAGSREVMLHAMQAASDEGIDYDCVILLQPTSPLRTAADICAAAELYSKQECDMIVSVTTAPCNPYYDLFETQADGTLHVCKGDGLLTRRQDAPKVYLYNGAVYVINPESLKKMSLGEFPRRLPYFMKPGRSIDLDTPADWETAEKIIASCSPSI